MPKTIPHLNLSDYVHGNEEERQTFSETLGKGLEQFGFLTLGNHGFDRELVETCYRHFRTFFALDEPIKDKYDCVTLGARGYTPFGREHAKDSNVPDLKEFYHVGQELLEDHPLFPVYPQNVWPGEVAELREPTLQLFRKLEQCATTLLYALAEYYELPRTTFADMITAGNSVLRVIHYPPLQPGMPNNALRAAPHEDINFLTLLIESQGDGLEILSRDREWIPVSALSGDIIVDSGDMLSRLTNGVIPATTHRVVNPKDGANVSRYSMPFFVHPYPTCDLSVMDRFITTDRPAQWPAITAGEFLEERLRAIGMREDSDD